MTRGEVINGLRQMEEFTFARIAFYNGVVSFREIADMLEKSEPSWISVKDALPEIGGSYLVALNDGYVASTEYMDDGFELWADAGEVTHWMPLPELPKEDE